MASLVVCYCKGKAELGLSVADVDYGTSHNITIQGSSTQGAKTAENKHGLIMLYADTECRFAVGSDPTATTSSPGIAAGGILFVRCEEGDKVAAISFDGT